jgi:hypothetical protein
MQSSKRVSWRAWWSAALLTTGLALAAPSNVHAQEATPQELKIFHLQFIEARNAGATISQVLEGNQNLRLAVDGRTNSLIVSAPAEQQRQIEALLSELDQRGANTTSDTNALPPVTVRVIWLGSKVQGADVPPGLEPVVQELGALGITDLSLVGQMMINVGDTSKSFGVVCRPQLGDASYQLHFEGIQTDSKDGRPMLNVVIEGHQVANGEEIANIADISATVEAPLNQFIVLGSTSADGWDSVFVLQLVPRSMAAVKK